MPHNKFYMSDIVSGKQFNREDIEHLIQLAYRIEEQKVKFNTLLQGKVMAALFFEPSTRTRLSFESAFAYLGGKVIGFSSGESSSVKKEKLLQIQSELLQIMQILS